MQKTANIFVCIALFICLQVTKPTVFMEVYKLVFNFHPSLYGNWELYKLVWLNIQAGAMSAKVTVPLFVAEATWLFIPVGLYQYLNNKRLNVN